MAYKVYFSKFLPIFSFFNSLSLLLQTILLFMSGTKGVQLSAQARGMVQEGRYLAIKQLSCLLAYLKKSGTRAP